VSALPETPAGPSLPPAGSVRPEGPARWAPISVVPAFVTAIAISAFGAILVGVVAGVAGASLSADELPPAVTIASTVLQDVGFILGALLFAWLSGRPRGWYFGLNPPGSWSAAGWTALAYVGFFLFAAAWGVVLKLAFDYEAPEDDLPSELGADESTAALIAVAVLVCVLAPIAEEFFFRGYMFAALRNWKGVWPAALITGGVFGAIHLVSSEPAFIPPLMAFGVVLCLLYQHTGSLLPCIALHGTNNALAFGVTQSWTWQIPVAIVVSVAVALTLVWPFCRRSAAPGVTAP